MKVGVGSQVELLRMVGHLSVGPSVIEESATGRAAVVLDWKSDTAPTEEDMRIHAGQLEDH